MLASLSVCSQIANVSLPEPVTAYILDSLPRDSVCLRECEPRIERIREILHTNNYVNRVVEVEEMRRVSQMSDTGNANCKVK